MNSCRSRLFHENTSVHFTKSIRLNFIKIEPAASISGVPYRRVESWSLGLVHQNVNDLPYDINGYSDVSLSGKGARNCRNRIERIGIILIQRVLGRHSLSEGSYIICISANCHATKAVWTNQLNMSLIIIILQIFPKALSGLKKEKAHSRNKNLPPQQTVYSRPTSFSIHGQRVLWHRVVPPASAFGRPF